MRVAVFGAGYVGLVTGACFADLGHDVVVRDIDAAKVDALRRGVVPIHEEGLAELLERNAESLSFTTDVAEAVDGRVAQHAVRRGLDGDGNPEQYGRNLSGREHGAVLPVPNLRTGDRISDDGQRLGREREYGRGYLR